MLQQFLPLVLFIIIILLLLLLLLLLHLIWIWWSCIAVWIACCCQSVSPSVCLMTMISSSTSRGQIDRQTDGHIYYTLLLSRLLQSSGNFYRGRATVTTHVASSSSNGVVSVGWLGSSIDQSHLAVSLECSGEQCNGVDVDTNIHVIFVAQSTPTPSRPPSIFIFLFKWIYCLLNNVETLWIRKKSWSVAVDALKFLIRSTARAAATVKHPPKPPPTNNTMSEQQDWKMNKWMADEWMDGGRTDRQTLVVNKCNNHHYLLFFRADGQEIVVIVLSERLLHSTRCLFTPSCHRSSAS